MMIDAGLRPLLMAATGDPTQSTAAVVAAIASAGSAVAALATIVFAILTAAKHTTAVDRLLELDTRIQLGSLTSLKNAMTREISEHAADLIARRRVPHPLVPEAVLWAAVTLLLAAGTAPGIAAETANSCRVTGYILGGVLIAISIVVEVKRLVIRRRLLRP